MFNITSADGSAPNPSSSSKSSPLSTELPTVAWTLRYRWTPNIKRESQANKSLSVTMSNLDKFAQGEEHRFIDISFGSTEMIILLKWLKKRPNRENKDSKVINKSLLSHFTHDSRRQYEGISQNLSGFRMIIYFKSFPHYFHYNYKDPRTWHADKNIGLYVVAMN